MVTGGPAAVDDVALLAWIQSGEVAALDVFFRQYHQRVYGWAVTTLRDAQLAEEATSQVLLAVTRTRLAGAAALAPYVRRTTLNACATVLRSRGRAMETELVDEPADTAATLGATADRTELQQIVWQAMAGLSPRDRFLFEAEWRDRLDNAELAELAGTAQPYVVLNRMRKQVKAALGAALVAWYGRNDCPRLATIVASTGRELSPLLRKRVNRHINGTALEPSCQTCRACRDRWPLPVLGAAVPVVAVPSLLGAHLHAQLGAGQLGAGQAVGATARLGNRDLSNHPTPDAVTTQKGDTGLHGHSEGGAKGAGDGPAGGNFGSDATLSGKASAGADGIGAKSDADTLVAGHKHAGGDRKQMAHDRGGKDIHHDAEQTLVRPGTNQATANQANADEATANQATANRDGALRRAVGNGPVKMTVGVAASAGLVFAVTALLSGGAPPSPITLAVGDAETSQAGQTPGKVSTEAPDADPAGQSSSLGPDEAPSTGTPASATPSDAPFAADGPVPAAAPAPVATGGPVPPAESSGTQPTGSTSSSTSPSAVPSTTSTPRAAPSTPRTAPSVRPAPPTTPPAEPNPVTVPTTPPDVDGPVFGPARPRANSIAQELVADGAGYSAGPPPCAVGVPRTTDVTLSVSDASKITKVRLTASIGEVSLTSTATATATANGGGSTWTATVGPFSGTYGSYGAGGTLTLTAAATDAAGNTTIAQVGSLKLIGCEGNPPLK